MRAKEKSMQSLFDSIANEYDPLNHILSLDIDKTWRRRAAKQVIDASSPQQILDIACGTGDFSIILAKKSHSDSIVTGLDLSEGMLKVMGEKVKDAGLEKKIKAEQGNSCQMRFEDNSFDCATIAFGIRNFDGREEALREILRILKPDGRLLILELSVPESPIIKWVYKLYFTNVLPILGGWISGNKSAYKYLVSSVLRFPGRTEWMATMERCGFRNVRHKAYSFGICRMYTGDK